MILGTIGLFLVIIALVIAFASTRPSDFRVARSASIPAPASIVFEQVNDLRKWDAWSPWAKLDPNAKNFFEGPSSGAGAVMKWEGNNKVGAGIMTIVESVPPQLVKFKLQFLRPFKATNAAEFVFKEHGGETEVTWSMTGTNSLMGKIMSLFMNCDKMVGGQFEQGLRQLSAVSVAAKAA